MATTVGNAVTALQTAITAALGPTPGTAAIAKCVRRYIIPANEYDRPIVGLIVDRGRRTIGPVADAKWETTVLMQVLLAAEKGAAAEDAALELFADIMGVVNTHNGSGSAGGFWDRPVWEYWTELAAPTVPCGVFTTLRLRTDGSLKVP